jgi:hypothetical protein
MFFSASTGGFYDPKLNADIPGDAVEVTASVYLDLLSGQAAGSFISSGDDGHPVLIPAATGPGTIQIVTARQAKLALLDAGLFDDIETYIGTLDGVEGKRAKIAWECASTFRRDDQLLNAVAEVKGLSAAEIDHLFWVASQIPK